MQIKILRGLPGSGKNYYIEQLKKDGKIVFECSADLFFVDKDGVYMFDPKRIGEAHKYSKDTFWYHLKIWNRFLADPVGNIEIIERYKNHVLICNNTNTTLLEMDPYITMCDIFEHPYEIIWMKCSAETSIERNVHNVPEETIRRMAKRFEGTGEKIGFGWKQTIIKTDAV